MKSKFAINSITKLDSLIKHKENVLSIRILDTEIGKLENAYMLAHRSSDNTYIVWTAKHTGVEHTTYVDFVDGCYGLTIQSAVSEMQTRLDIEERMFENTSKLGAVSI